MKRSATLLALFSAGAILSAPHVFGATQTKAVLACWKVGDRAMTLRGELTLKSDYRVCFGLAEACESQRQRAVEHDGYILSLEVPVCISPADQSDADKGTSHSARYMVIEKPGAKLKRILPKLVHHSVEVTGKLVSQDAISLSSIIDLGAAPESR